MPEFVFDCAYPQAVGTVEVAGLTVPSMAVVRGAAVVRRPGSDPSRDGREYPYLSSGTLTTGTVPMSALTGVFGVRVSATWPSGLDAEDACTLQVSVDGGVTFLAWDGADWSEQAEDETYNSVATFCEHCPDLPLLNPRSLTFRVRVAATAQVSPRLTGVSAYVEWDYSPLLDVDQLLHDLMSKLTLPAQFVTRLGAAASRVTPPGALTPDLTLGARIYNLTTDPLRNVDIFDAVDGPDLLLTAEQAQGSLIQINFRGRAPVVIGHQDEMLTLTKVPSVVIHVGRPAPVHGNVAGLQYDYRRGETVRLVRVRRHPELVSVPVEVRVVVAEPRAAREALEAVRDVLRASVLRSPSSGMLVQGVEDAPGVDLPDVPEGVDVARWAGRLICQFPARQYEEYAGIRAVDMEIGGRRVWETARAAR